MTLRTRIKICGLTRHQDVQEAVKGGADALGFVFYLASPRYVSPQAVRALLSGVPPFTTSVGLFVNASAEEVESVLQVAPVSMLQFHGDETAEACAAIAEAVNRPFLKAVRMAPEIKPDDLIECDEQLQSLSGLYRGLLLDAYADGYGGSGKGFDWSRIPEKLAPRVVLSGGLSAQNVADAISRVSPCAVDVSSGVESAKGVKDAAKLQAFFAQSASADAARRHTLFQESIP